MQNNLTVPDNAEKMMKFDNTGWNERITYNTDTRLHKYIYIKHIAMIFQLSYPLRWIRGRFDS